MCDQLTDQRHHAGDDRCFGMMTVGEKRVVGDIDVMRIRPGGDDLTQDGEPAEAGIEHQNRGRR